ncbi:hypothetical protein VTJ04DRAFT_9993 [Mycothermus thermophilus]|uniref:uncharacterized protein n=1 Tax=Humicola insolens TaxID=85995 RepID=UPI0037442475
MPPSVSSARDDVVEWPWRLPDTGVAAALEPGVRLLLLRVVHLGCDLARDGHVLQTVILQALSGWMRLLVLVLTWLDAMVTSWIQSMEWRGLRHDRLVQAASSCWPQPREDPLLGQHSQLAAPSLTELPPTDPTPNQHNKGVWQSAGMSRSPTWRRTKSGGISGRSPWHRH